MTDVIKVQNVYKQYDTIGTMRIRTILQDAVLAFRATSAVKRDPNVESRYVLNDINFNLEQGQSLGFIGHNGSGKTTLLRLLAGVSLPTKGRIQVTGKVAPLLALGAGFHQELTGHENLFLNCTLMGLSHKQSLDRIEQIIEFADIGDYIEVPIKRYSSGMLARLGFAAAIHMNPEIILLDEVLSVGDYNFSVKAKAAIRQFVGKGTLVFVSHDMDSVKRLCERVIWIDHGRMREDGNAAEVIEAYLKDQKLRDKVVVDPSAPYEVEAATPDAPKTVTIKNYDPRVTITAVTTHNKNGDPQTAFGFGEDIRIRCHLHLTEPMPELRAVIGITHIATRSVVTACDNQTLGSIGDKAGDIVLEGWFPSTHFRPHGLGVWIGISDPIKMVPMATWNDIVPRLYSVGPARDAQHHYFEPQGDLIYTPDVKMHIIDKR